MLKDCKEEDFYELRMVSVDRLSPDGIAAFFITSLAVSSIFTAVCVLGLYKNKNITNPIWSKVINAMLILLLIQAIVAFLYLRIKTAFKHQKFQAVWLNIISIKISIDMYPCYFLACDDRHAASYMSDIGWLFLLGGFAYLILSIIRGAYRVKNGMFKKGGRYLYDFSNSKLHFSAPLIYGIVIIAGNLSRKLSASSDGNSQIFGLIILLVCGVFLQYGIAMAWPEFFLLAYCKFRFKSFTEEMPEINIEKKSVIIKKGTKARKGNVFTWYKMPIKVLKSFAGWKVKEKAPISALILTYFETSIVTYVVLLLICFYGMLMGFISVNGFMMRFSMAVVPAFAIAFMVDVVVLILLKIVEPFFYKPLSKNAIIKRIIIGIGLIIAIILLNTPFATDYIGAIIGLIISLMTVWAFGICTIKSFNDKTKKLRRNTKVIINRSPKEYIGYVMGVIITIAGSFAILLFSFHIILAIYNTVEYNKGNFVEHEFKINSLKFGHSRSSSWIRSVKATNVNTGEEVNFKCSLGTRSLMEGEIYDIKYIPFSNRIINVKHEISLTLGIKWMKFK